MFDNGEGVWDCGGIHILHSGIDMAVSRKGISIFGGAEIILVPIKCKRRRKVVVL